MILDGLGSTIKLNSLGYDDSLISDKLWTKNSKANSLISFHLNDLQGLFLDTLIDLSLLILNYLFFTNTKSLTGLGIK